MVNLLARASRPDPFPALDGPAWHALVSRVAGCSAFRQVYDIGDGRARSAFQARLETLSSELDELESAPALAGAASLIEALDQIRHECLADASATASADRGDASAGAGSLLCYFPGRSLSTGEAEVASRGYFDVLDRPPLSSWVAAVGRPTGSTGEAFEVGILTWVATADVDVARAGYEASAAHSLIPIEEVSIAIAMQWRSAQGYDRGEP